MAEMTIDTKAIEERVAWRGRPIPFAIQADMRDLLSAVKEKDAEIVKLREALLKARGWLSGWQSAEDEITIIDAALTAQEPKS